MSIGFKLTYVGRFFEELGQAVLGGELARNECGDVWLPKHKTSVEVKASGFRSSYGFRLDLDQIASYDKKCRSMAGRSWYMFFAYRNNPQIIGGKRAPEFSAHSSEEAVKNYLLGAVKWCILLDLSIIKKLRDTGKISHKSIMGHLGTKTVDISCPNAEAFVCNGAGENLRALGLKSDRYTRLVGDLEVISHQEGRSDVINFPLYAIVPTGDAKLLKRLLTRRGFKISSMR